MITTAISSLLQANTLLPSKNNDATACNRLLPVVRGVFIPTSENGGPTATASGFSTR